MTKRNPEEDDEADDGAEKAAGDFGGIDGSGDQDTSCMQGEEVEGDRSPDETENLNDHMLFKQFRSWKRATHEERYSNHKESSSTHAIYDGHANEL